MKKREKIYHLYDNAGHIRSTSNKNQVKRDLRELTPTGGKWIIYITTASGLGFTLLKIIMKFV